MLPSSARFTRLLTATIAALAALTAGAGSAQAAAPCPEGFTAGNKLCLATTHEPAGDFVIPNGYIRYRVDLTNPGPATATKVALTFTLDTQTTLKSAPAGCTQPSVPPQPPVTVITCSLGSVKPTGTSPVTLRFLVQAPSFETSTSAVARVSADARQNDKQENPENPDPTDEDFADIPEVVTVDSRQGLSASFVPADTEVTLDTDTDDTGATLTDKRTAVFVLFANGFSTTATVNDNVEDTFVCPQGLKCPSGGWTEAVIPGPPSTKPPFDPLLQPFLPPSRMELELRYDSTTLNGVKPNSYVLIHDLDYDASTTTYELIETLCGSNPKPPCLRGRPVLLPDGDLLVKAFVTGNWRYR
jgi:uncharacterized repeat protein (TIGR01451 family)